MSRPAVRRVLVATALVSAGAIGYELLLMRTLSIVQWHHFAYMIISLALLGYGVSGTFIALSRSWLEQRFEQAFSASALLFSVAMLVSFVSAQRVPFNALEVIWDWRQLVYLGCVYLIFFVPFFFAACCIGLALTCRRSAVAQIYFSDLLGAGLGAVLIVVSLFVLLPQHALLLLMILPLLASMLVALRPVLRFRLVAMQLAWLAALVFGFTQNWPDLRISEYKGLSQALEVVDSRVLSEASSPLGLITVIDSPAVPIRHAPGLSFNTRHIPPPQLGVFTDADAMSVITRFDGDFDAVAYLGDVTAALPYALLEQPRVLVLGAGGGSDVLLALYHGASRVDAVELNPQMTALIEAEYAEFAGRLYDDPRVLVHTDEARGFVAKSDTRYDLVHLGLLDSFAASGAGVQALNESYLYTVEALTEYLEHTAPGGILAITRWLKLPPRASLKLVAIAIEALARQGVDDPGRRLVLIRSWDTSTLLVKNGDFSDTEIDSIRAFAQARSFDTAYFPGIHRTDTNRFNRLHEPYFYDGIVALLGDNADDFIDRYKFRIEPATDDRPYFFHFFKWATLPEVLALRKAGGAGLIEWGYLILAATLLQALVAGLLLIVLPLLRTARDWPAGTASRAGSYFLLLGLAFLFVEIAFIQKFILFLSHPLYSVAVVLSGFLIFAGVGSAWSARLARRYADGSHVPVAIAVGGIVVLALAYVFLLTTVFELFIGAGDVTKIVLSIALIAPLAFCMGMPFPLGLRRLAATAPGFIPWAWGANGFASVVSAVLASLLAIQFGFTFVILLALVLYSIAALVFAAGDGHTQAGRS